LGLGVDGGPMLRGAGLVGVDQLALSVPAAWRWGVALVMAYLFVAFMRRSSGAGASCFGSASGLAKGLG